MPSYPNPLEQLRAGGHRLTDARKTIIDILLTTQQPLRAIDIQNVFASRARTVDKVTIYRELRFLVAQGIVTDVHLNDRHIRYELASRDHHHHLICEKCHGVEDVAFEEDFQKQTALVQQQRGFTILHHSLEFFGVCARCNA